MKLEEELELRDKALSCTVVSLIPWDLFEEKPGLYPGKFKIPKSDGKSPSIIHVKKAHHFVYLDDTRGSLSARDPSDEVAASIVRDYLSSQLAIDENAKPGLFWIPGVILPSEVERDYEAELAKARAEQQRWFLNICRIADDDWTRYQKHSSVSDFQRIAAQFLGWDPEAHPWMSPEKAKVPEITTKCVSCNSEIPGDPVVCPSCKCILKPEMYEKLKFAH